VRGRVAKSGCRRGPARWLVITQIDPHSSVSLSSHLSCSFSSCETAKRRSGSVEFVTLLSFFSSIDRHRYHRYAIGFLTRSSSRPLASVYNYVWYCNIGAARFGWWAVFILKAEILLLYHSSSADIPEMGKKDGIFRRVTRGRFKPKIALARIKLLAVSLSLNCKLVF